MFRNTFGGFLVLQLWLYMRYLCLTISFWGTTLFASTVTMFLLLSWCFIQEFAIMLLDQIFHIGGATVATFDSIAVKDLAEFMVLWEILPDKF